MARWQKRKERKPERRGIISVPLKPLQYESDEKWEEDGIVCDWCGKRVAEDADTDAEWRIGPGVTVDGLLALARYCPDCFLHEIEWGRAYCPGGFGTPVIPLGVE